MQEDTRLYRNTKKTKKTLFSAVAVSLFLALILVYCMGVFDGELRLKPAIFSGAVLLIMLFLTINSLIGIRDKSPMIYLDTTGFSGRTTPLAKAFGRVEWKDVRDVELQKIGGDTLVAVTVGHTDKYTGRLSKMFWKMAYDEQNQILNLMYSASEIDVDAKELYSLFRAYWENVGNSVVK
jgi:hypothetical protein